MATVHISSTSLAPPGAVAYAWSRLGYRVLPLHRDTGTPALANWPGAATTDEALIQQWWTGDYAGCGVGIATGPQSGVWVLDIDVKDADGFASLRALTLGNDATVAVFTRTMTVRTPSGGAHVYFKWDAASDTEGGIRNSSKQLAPGLDVRGIRGCVRAPEVGAYRIVERNGVKSTALTSAPEWLVSMCKKRRTPGRGDPVSAEGAADRYRVSQTLRHLSRAPEGTRNDALNRSAFLLALGGAVTRENAWEACRSIMKDIGARDDADTQRRTFESGWDSGTTKRGGVG